MGYTAQDELDKAAILDGIYRKVFGTFTIESTPAAAWRFDGADIVPVTTPNHRVEAVLILMSRFTERLIMEADRSNTTGINSNFDRSSPRRVWGIRYAIDDSLSLGHVLISDRVF